LDAAQGRRNGESQIDQTCRRIDGTERDKTYAVPEARHHVREVVRGEVGEGRQLGRVKLFSDEAVVYKRNARAEHIGELIQIKEDIREIVPLVLRNLDPLFPPDDSHWPNTKRTISDR
jgi:hypothetical protein